MSEMQFYPLGTIVRLRGRSEHYMICGYLRSFADGVVCDYSAVRYPMGYDSIGSVLAFSAADIETVVFEGMKDEESGKLLDALPRLRNAACSKAAEEAERLRKQVDEQQQVSLLEE